MINFEDLDSAEERKIYIPSSGGQMLEVKDYHAIWNLNLNQMSSIVSKGYNLIQHQEAVNSLMTALKNLNINFTSNLRVDKHRIFLDILFPEVKMSLSDVGDEVIGGIRLINSYDKSTGLMILPRLMRLVCNNGMVVSEFMSGFSLRHNQKLVLEFQSHIEKTINMMINSCEILKRYVNESIKDSIEWKFAETVLQNLISGKKHRENILKILNEKKDSKFTRWELYNAITFYTSHNEQLKPNVESWIQEKAQRLLKTELNQFLEVKQ